METNLAKRLVEFRKFNNLSQEELAQKLSVSRQSISNWESGDVSPSVEYVIKMAEIYDVSVDDLVNSSVPVDEVYKKKAEQEAASKANDGGKKFVHISKKGIFINDGEDDVSISASGIKENGKDIFDMDSDNIDGYKEKMEKKRKVPILSNLFDGVYVLLTVVVYILLGFLLPNGLGWYGFWPLFVLVGVPGQLIKCFALKKPNNFPIPQIAITTYLFVGMLLPNNTGWHPYWVILFIIPIYYTIANAITELRRKKVY